MKNKGETNWPKKYRMSENVYSARENKKWNFDEGRRKELMFSSETQTDFSRLNFYAISKGNEDLLTSVVNLLCKLTTQ